MNRFTAVCFWLVGWSLWGSSPAHAGYEWWHHQVGMDISVYDCMESCYHIDNTGEFTTVAHTKNLDIELGSVTVDVSLNETCYGTGTVHLSTEVTATRSMTVSATSEDGGEVSIEASIGDAAKGEVESKIGWNHNWNWQTNATYAESFMLGAGGTVDWPQSGERRVFGSGAKISCEIKVYGDRSSFDLEARRQHLCKTTIGNPRYYDGTCGGRVPGTIAETPYSGHGTVQFTGRASGENPKRVVIGPITETGMILVGCDGGA